MSLNANLVSPPLSPQQQDTDLPAAFVPGAPDVANPSEPKESGPRLLNRAATNSSVGFIYEVNQPSTPIAEHSALEKSPRSTDAILAALPNTTDDPLESLKQSALSGNANAQYKLGYLYFWGEEAVDSAILWSL